MRWMVAMLASLPAWGLTTDFSQIIQLKVEKYQLKNGLVVLLQEDHSVPLVTYETWFRVGSKDEDRGRTGLAHFFEHMMFKGTETVSKESYANQLQTRGADFNAFTTSDFTYYLISGPKDTLPTMITLEADRMRHLAFKPDDIQKEREVVKEEKRVDHENKPQDIILENLDDMLFTNLPYKWPVIGSMEDLNQASTADFRAFYQRYYAPNNAIVVVAGDFDPAQVKAWIDKAYGSLKAEKIDRKTFSAEVTQLKRQERTITHSVQSPIVAMAFRTPPAESYDTFSTDLLLTLLGTGDSSRLQKKLVYERQLASSVTAGCADAMLASRCIIMVDLKPNASPKEVVQLVTDEFVHLGQKKVSEQELQKAKNITLMAYIDSIEKMHGRADSLGLNELMFGDYKRLFTDVPRIQALTAEQIQTVARKYFQPHSQNVLFVEPAKEVPKEAAR